MVGVCLRTHLLQWRKHFLHPGGTPSEIFSPHGADYKDFGKLKPNTRDPEGSTLLSIWLKV